MRADSVVPKQPGREIPWPRALFLVVVTGGLALAVLAAPCVSGATTLHHAVGGHTAQPPSVFRLPAGSTLEEGQSLVSRNGKYMLDMQGDGNLVLYWEHQAIWQSHTRRDVPDSAIMQADGNFVVYVGQQAVWNSGSTQSDRGAYSLVVQNDGNMVIYTAANKPIWESHTNVQPGLHYGDSGPAVLMLQERLSSLGYWLGPPNGVFGDSTQQAVWALQKAADLDRDGVVGPLTVEALAAGVVPTPRPAPGNLVEVDLSDDLLMVMQKGKLAYTLNTSTGGGYVYTDMGVTSVAITPRGVFHIFGSINGLDVDSLGALWRPRFFVYTGIAVHGDSYVPPYPVSHGCVRVSNEAIDWIWANNIMPIGEEVWVY